MPKLNWPLLFKIKVSQYELGYYVTSPTSGSLIEPQDQIKIKKKKLENKFEKS